MFDLSSVPNIVDDGSGTICVSKAEDAIIQAKMIEEHRWFLGIAIHREPTTLESFQSWVDKGLAEKYRRHIKIKERIEGDDFFMAFSNY